MSTPPQLTADPDDALWEGPTGAVAAVLEQPKRLLLPCCGEVPPSLTAKRQKGKILQLLPFDLSVRPNAEGAWLCTTCPATYESRAQLFGHVRFCEGQNVWSCEWCGCRESETHHKASGPSGAKTLCSACGARFRSGHNTPPAQNDKGEYACDFCGRGFPSISSLGGHRRFCDGGMWRCAWCHLSGQECGNKSVGPDGPATLCTSCSQRWKSGHSGPPPKDETGRYVCEECGRAFDTISGLGSHRARCDGGVWRCEWCNADYASSTGKVRWLVLASPHPLPSSLTLTPAPAPNHPALPSSGPRPQRSQDALLGLLCALPRRRQRAAHHQRARQVRVRLVRAHLRHAACAELAQASVRRRQVAVRLVRVQGGRVYGQGPGAGRPEYTMCQLLGEVPQRRDGRRQARRQGELPLRLRTRLCDQRGAGRPPAQLQAAGCDRLPGGGRHLLGP